MIERFKDEAVGYVLGDKLIAFFATKEDAAKLFATADEILTPLSSEEGKALLTMAQPLYWQEHRNDAGTPCYNDAFGMIYDMLGDIDINDVVDYQRLSEVIAYLQNSIAKCVRIGRHLDKLAKKDPNPTVRGLGFIAAALLRKMAYLVSLKHDYILSSLSESRFASYQLWWEVMRPKYLTSSNKNHIVARIDCFFQHKLYLPMQIHAIKQTKEQQRAIVAMKHIKDTIEQSQVSITW